MRISRTGLAAATAALFAAAVPAAAADPLTPYTTQQLQWGDCPFKPRRGDAPVQCALVTVPRDWADPGCGHRSPGVGQPRRGDRRAQAARSW